MHNKVLLLSFYSFIINALFRPINSTLSAITGYITILLAILYPIIRSKQKGKLLVGKTPFLFSIVLIISMISSIDYFTKEDIENQAVAIVSFIILYWSLSIKKTDKNDVLDLQDICKANYLLCGVLLLFGFGPFSFRYTVVDAWGNKVFSMGLGNPNVVSVYVMFAIIILLVHIVNQKKIMYKVVDLMIITLLFYLLIELSSRTVVACVLLLIIGYFIGKRSNKMQCLWGLVIAWPFIMIFVTLIMGEKNIAIQLLGKALETGRYGMYITTISDIKSSPLSFVFGQALKYKFTNMHNAPLTIITNVGIVGLLIYLAFWYKEIKLLNDCCQTTIQRISFYAMLAFIIQSSSESLSMVGTIPYAIMVIIVDRISKGEVYNVHTLSTYE